MMMEEDSYHYHHPYHDDGSGSSGDGTIGGNDEGSLVAALLPSSSDSFLDLLLSHAHRRLQDGMTNGRGRTVLTVLYICVLSLCFVTPIFYYCRLQYEDRTARRLRDMEIAGIRTAMELSASGSVADRDGNILNILNFGNDGTGGGREQDEQSRAQRRKYIEERRARLLQLLAPVTMVRVVVIMR